MAGFRLSHWPSLLLKFNGAAIWGDVLDVDAQRFTEPQPSSRTKDEQHAE